MNYGAVILNLVTHYVPVTSNSGDTKSLVWGHHFFMCEVIY